MPLQEWIESMRCPEHGARISLGASGLACECGHAIALEDGIPRFSTSAEATGRDRRWSRFYDAWAPCYDLSERLACRMLLGIDVLAERAAIVEALGLEPGMRLLEISPGPGVYQGLLTKAVGPTGRLACLDLSAGMLSQCARAARQSRADPLLVQANAARLPFADQSFEAVFHFGGVRLFDEPDRALAEMVRVTRPGGRVAWGDEGFGEGAPRGWRRRLLERVNAGFAAPMPAVPRGVEVEATREVMGGCAWLVVARKCRAECGEACR